MFEDFATLFVTLLIEQTGKQYTNIRCYEINSNTRTLIPIIYSTSMKSVPEKLRVNIQITDHDHPHEGKVTKEFDATLVPVSCVIGSLNIPNLMNDHMSQQDVVIRLFHVLSSYELERFEFNMKRGFQNTNDMIKGLNGLGLLPVYFSPTHKNFGPYNPVGLPHYHQLPALKDEEFYCARPVHGEQAWVVRIDGQEFRRKAAYKYYIFELEAIHQSLTAHHKKILVETFVCSPQEPLIPLRITTSQMISSLKITATSGVGNGDIQMTYVYDKASGLFSRSDASQVALSPVEVSAEPIETAIKSKFAHLMFPTKERRVVCTGLDLESYVDVCVSGSQIVCKKSHIASYSGTQQKIIKIEPGSQETVENCLRNFDPSQ